MKKANIPFELVNYCEIDKYASKSYSLVHSEPETKNLWDVTKIDVTKLSGDIDLITHGSPCQDFSLAGKQAGGDEGSGTRSSLMYETIKIVKHIRPKYVLWENVKNLLSKKHRHNFDAYLTTLEDLGYVNFYQVLNAKNYGIPQNRERVFTISIRKDLNKNFEFPKPFELKLRLKDILEKEVDEKYYLSDKQICKIVDWKAYQKPFERELGENSVSPTLTARGAGENHSGMILYCEDLEDTSNLQDECLKIKEKTKKGYAEAEEGDGVYINRPHQKRGVVQKGMIQTIKTSLDVGVVVKGPRVRDECPAINTTITQASFITKVKQSPLRIRKLTPKECWRLMGFDDEDFSKVEGFISNTQLYKQAGNSIVVDVLKYIYLQMFNTNTNLIKEKQNKEFYKRITIFDFI